MAIAPPKVTAAPKIQRLSVKDWLKGYNSNLDDGRTPNEGLRQAVNVLLYQDGTIGPARSLVTYGEEPVGPILGEVFPFVDSTGSGRENWLVSMQVVGGVGKVYISKDGEAWIECTGKTYSATQRAHFEQVDDKILVLNGLDELSYVDISSGTISSFTALTTPSAPTLSVGAQLVGTTYPIRYRITATNTGETAASVAGTSTVSKLRDIWVGTTGGATEYVDVTITRVAGAQRYSVYVGDTAGNEVFIESIPDPGSGTTFTYRDTGAAVRDVTRLAPIADTTAGIKATRAKVINDRVFLVGDIDNPDYVWYGGTGDSTLDFSPYGGGGYSSVGGKGQKQIPVAIQSFRNPQGNSVITVLCSGDGKRYTMTPLTQTVGDQTLFTYEVNEVNGDGTDSPDGVVQTKDSLWYPSRGGFKTTGTKPQLQNVLSTNVISETIQNDVTRLNTQSMANCVGLEYEGRIYWALPVGTEENNQIWTLDLTRQGAWMLPLEINADWMTLYTDNTGATHFLVLKDDLIYEFTESRSTMYGDVAFDTLISSGFLKFSEDGMDWARVIDVTFIVLRPQGTISVSVSGKTEEDSLTTLETASFTPDFSVAGWGEFGWSANYLGWSGSAVVPTSYGNAREQKVLEIDEDLNYITFDVGSTGAGVSYQLSDVVVRYVNIGVIDQT